MLLQSSLDERADAREVYIRPAGVPYAETIETPRNQRVPAYCLI